MRRRSGSEKGGEVPDQLFFHKAELAELVTRRLARRVASIRQRLFRAIEVAGSWSIDLQSLC